MRPFFSNPGWPGKRKTHRFLTHNHSLCPVSRLLERLHFCQIKFRLGCEKGRFSILTGKKTFCLLPGKELCQIGPEMRRFCISTTKIREWLCVKMRTELIQMTLF